MPDELSLADLDFILESLSFTKIRFDQYQWPNYEQRRERIDQLETVVQKLRAYRKRLKHAR